MIFQSPVRSPIHISRLALQSLVAANAYAGTTAYWTRPPGNTDFAVTQFFGPTNVTSEPTISWPGGEGIKAGSYSDFHRGIDLGNARAGDPVYAAAAGKVIGLYKAGANGADHPANYVKIDHGVCPVCGHHFETWYWHLATVLVTLGQQVAAGARIATVGSTGANAAHEHFEVHRDAALVDPYPRLAQNTTVDIDAENEMILTKYLPLYTATVAKGFNVRSGPTTQDKVVRLTSAAESWQLLGVAKGELVSGSADWYVRVNGLAFEFIHSSAVSGVTKPVSDADLAAARADGYAAGKAEAKTAALAAHDTETAALQAI